MSEEKIVWRPAERHEPTFIISDAPLSFQSILPPPTWPTCTTCGRPFDVDYFTAGNVVVLKPVASGMIYFQFSDRERFVRTGFVCEACHANTRQRLL